MAAKKAPCWKRGQGRLPRWSPKSGWIGGSKRTLFLFTDKLTGKSSVAPPHAGPGPNCDVRIATRVEAEGRVKNVEGWQSPLHAGWKVACNG